MKKSVILSSFFIVILILFACTKEKLDHLQDKVENKDVTLETRATNTVFLSPSGDATGITDANAIESALNTPGSQVIVLSEGTFFINRTISAISGFEGSLEGQGKNTTFIKGVGNSANPFQRGFIHVPLEPDPLQAAAFFYFPEPSNDLEITNLSMFIPSGFLAETSNLDNTDNLTVFVSVQLGSSVADVTLKNVNLTGTDAAPGSPDWYFNQPNFDAVILGDRDETDFPQPSNSGGKINIQQSQISSTSYQALIVEVLKEAKISIHQNTFSDTKQINIRFLDGCKVAVRNNTLSTTSWGSIVITQELALGYGPINGAANKIKIQDNQILSNGFLGIEIGAIPFPGAATFDLLIEGNNISKGPDPSPFSLLNIGGIGIYEGHNNAVVQYNTIQGEADFGVLLLDVDNSLLYQNITSGLSSSNADYGLLGPSDSNQLNVTHPATVVDEGAANVFSGPVTILP